MKIQEASIKDLDKIIKLNGMLFDYEKERFEKDLDLNWPKRNKAYFKKSITKRDQLALIVIENGKIIGYLIGEIRKLAKYREINEIAELDSMFLIKEYIGKGIGSELCNWFLEWARKKGVKIARVSASSENIISIACYKKLGFQNYRLMLEKKL